MISFMGLTPDPAGRLLIGGKPARVLDVDRIARLVGTSKAEVKPLLLELRDNGVFSEDDDGAIYSRRLRRATQISSARSAAGRASAAARGYQFSSKSVGDYVGTKQPTSEPTDAPTPTSTSTGTNTLDAAAKNNSQPPSAAGRVREEISHHESPALTFCRRFLARGIELGVIPEHHSLLGTQWALNNEPPARVLFATYDPVEIDAKMERFLTARQAGKLRLKPVVKSLSECWDWAELKTGVTVRPGSSYLDSLRDGDA
jgi:hypothetical protein